MANATKLPSRTALVTSTWSRPDGENPRLSRALTASATDIFWNVVPKKEDGTAITGAFLMGVKSSDNVTEQIWVPAGAVNADGLGATGIIRGIDISGIDYTTASGISGYAMAHEEGEPVFFVISAVIENLVRAALQGEIQTGGATLDMGTGSSEDIYIKHNGNPWLKQTSAGVAQYYNGSTYVNLNDSIASSLVKVSVTDTTPDYLYNKVGSSDGSIVFDITGDGADETLDMVTALPARISSHAIYTPAYMTGGTSAEQTIALWDSVTDGSFRLTLDGVTLNVTGINFTGITTMAQVASTIQTKLRTACGTTPTVVWSTNKFIITSSVTTSSSAVSVLTTSTASVGTDISGAGAGTWMDSESGRGTATAAVLDPTQDSGKVGLLNARGSFPADLARDFVDPLGYQAKGGIMVATAANTVDELVVGADNFGIRADSAQSTGVKWAPVNRLLSSLTTPVTVSNTTAETNLLSFSLAANTLSTGNVIKGKIFCSTYNEGAGATDDCVFRLKFGSTTIATLTIGDSTGASTGKRLDIDFILSATGATNSQKGTMLMNLIYPTGTNSPDDTINLTNYSASSNTSFASNSGTATEDTTSAKTFSITAQWGNASVANSVVAQHGYAELLAV